MITVHPTRAVMFADGGLCVFIVVMALLGASPAPAQDAGAADPGAATEHPEPSAIRLPEEVRGLVFLERRYKIEAVSFKALDESGVDFWGSDEVRIETMDAEGTTLSPEFGSVDSGDTHTFDPAKSCLLAVQPGEAILGVSSVCEAVGRPGPFWFDIEMWEIDDPVIIPPFAYGCSGAVPHEHTGGGCLPTKGADDFIGDAHLVFTAQELEAALPHVGDTYVETVALNPCYEAEICGGAWLPDYTFTYRITRMRNVVVGLGDLLDLATAQIKSRSDLEAVVTGIEGIEGPTPRPVVTKRSDQTVAGN